jgi:hypothetical protein
MAATSPTRMPRRLAAVRHPGVPAGVQEGNADAIHAAADVLRHDFMWSRCHCRNGSPSSPATLQRLSLTGVLRARPLLSLHCLPILRTWLWVMWDVRMARPQWPRSRGRSRRGPGSAADRQRAVGSDSDSEARIELTSYNSRGQKPCR